eukprot:CAMPEP_0194395706 /NCGR_PEP_ID=MMETSP0174-20130528/124571_1 /TAXON_ID=216777 /ORGANISM="Proboscia alata, Strain PI-D3" /LENGTH=968 /DNA_ID=CAMNT_0039191669 /DNA_START=117 /DNA_END=3023 /DNA_ORIENTATION=-
MGFGQKKAQKSAKKAFGGGGKKARKLAKIDRQWGEEVPDDHFEKQRKRTTKSRLGVSSKPKRVRKAVDADRQWGEEVPEDHFEKQRKRTTKSRLLTEKPKRTRVKYTDANAGNDKEEEGRKRSREYSSEEEEVETLAPAASLGVLMKQIRSQKLTNTRTTTPTQELHEPTDSSDPNSDSESEDETATPPTTNTNLNQIRPLPVIPDPYTFHFSKPPFPETSHESAMKRIEQTVETVLDPTLGLYYAPPPPVGPPVSINTALALQSVVAEEISHSPNELLNSLLVKSVDSADTAQAVLEQHVRKSLREGWESFNARTLTNDRKKRTKGSFTPLQATLFPIMSTYADVLITSETRQNREELQNTSLLHILNHVLTSRTRVQRHNKRVRELEKAHKKLKATRTTGDKSTSTSLSPNPPTSTHTQPTDEETTLRELARDQGYTRAKVLILLPTRGVCYTFLRRMLALLRLLPDDNSNPSGGDVTGVDQWERFHAEYGPPDWDEANKHLNTTDKDTKDEQRRKKVLKAKGPQWSELFGDDVNDDDEFKMGISVTPNVDLGGGKNKGAKKKEGNSGVAVKLYSEFYRSDILIASPLGLKMAISGVASQTDEQDEGNANNGNGRQKGDRNPKKSNIDFLSSIDICYIGHSDVLLMQNWDHVRTLFDNPDEVEDVTPPKGQASSGTQSLINHQPTQHNEHTDFSRVRPYFLSGQASRYRQLIMVSSLPDARLTSTFKRHAVNWEGRIRLRASVPSSRSALVNVTVPHVRQVFQHIPCSSLSQQSDSRVNHFLQTVLPPLIRLQQSQTLVYIPCYFDFCTIRNQLTAQRKTAKKSFGTEGVSFACISEYSRPNETTRSRGKFSQGHVNLMLYTGRAHFFYRHRLSGVKHLIFVGLPEHPEFYADGMNMLNVRPPNRGGGGRGDESDNSMYDDEEDSTPASCLALFTKYDAHSLERIVGTQHCSRMLTSDKQTFLFCS